MPGTGGVQARAPEILIYGYAGIPGETVTVNIVFFRLGRTSIQTTDHGTLRAISEGSRRLAGIP